MLRSYRGLFITEIQHPPCLLLLIQFSTSKKNFDGIVATDYLDKFIKTRVYTLSFGGV